MKNPLPPLFLLVIFMFACSQAPSSPKPLRLLIGTLTDSTSEGVYCFDFDTTTCQSSYSSHAEVENPTFMAVSKDLNFVYSVSELDSLSAEVVSYRYDSDLNSLTEISRSKTQGAYPCHIVSGDGWVATANYGGGSVSIFDVDSLGQLSSHLQLVEFKDKPLSNLHCLLSVNDGQTILATDLGKDKIYRFGVDSSTNFRLLEPSISLPKGTGPRHITLNPKGDKVYLIGEMSGVVHAFDLIGDSLVEFDRAASDSVGGGGSADIHISPDGRFLYASNRLKADGISTFAIDSISGKLTKIDYTLTGIHPRNFTLSPDGRLLLVACRDSNAVQIYKRDPQSGLLSYMGEQFDIVIDKPMFVKFI